MLYCDALGTHDHQDIRVRVIRIHGIELCGSLPNNPGQRMGGRVRIKYHISVELLLSERQRLLIQLSGVRRSKPRN